jgi:hypothetical protein
LSLSDIRAAFDSRRSVAADEEGKEFSDDAAAMPHAISVARNLTAEMISEGERIDA